MNAYASSLKVMSLSVVKVSSFKLKDVKSEKLAAISVFCEKTGGVGNSLELKGNGSG
jgi:hypothetical protein